MKQITFAFAMLFIISCNTAEIDNEKTIKENSFLIGKWTGNGQFLDLKFASQIGEVYIEVDIKEDYQIEGKIGDAKLEDITIAEASYGFELKGKLKSKIKEDANTDKDHLIILLVLNEENREQVKSSDANFHLKSNYSWDFGMRVGGVKLVKTSE